MLDDLKKLGYNVVEKEVKERTLLRSFVTKRILLAEGRNALLRLTTLSLDRYRLVVVTEDRNAIRSLLEEEGFEISSVAEDTIIASASFRSFVEALSKMKSIAVKLAVRR